MADVSNSIFMDTFKSVMEKPELHLGAYEDDLRTRKKLLFIAAERTAAALFESVVPPGTQAEGICKEAWIKDKARYFKRTSLSRDFWKIWPLGAPEESIVPDQPTDTDEPPVSSPASPMSFFINMDKKKNAGDEIKPPASVTYFAPEDNDWWTVPEGGEEPADFREAVTEPEKKFPINIDGVEFKSFSGTDVVLKNPDDRYASPVRVKITLPDDVSGGKAGARTKRGQEAAISRMLAPLSDLTGLGSIKTALEASVRMAHIAQQRQKAGLKTHLPGGHMVFTGRPGTGKTHTARLIANILHKAGILKHGHLIEVDRAALVGEYIGTTEAKTDGLPRGAGRHFVCRRGLCTRGRIVA